VRWASWRRRTAWRVKGQGKGALPAIVLPVIILIIVVFIVVVWSI
jgi:hypothetical protein